MPREVLSLAEVADALGVSARTIQRWVRAGVFPKPFRPSGRLGRPRWRRADIELFVKAGSIHAYRRERRK